MQDRCHDFSRSIETFDKCRRFHSYSHFHLPWNIKYFSQGNLRQDPSINSKKKPDSEDKDKADEEEDKEKEEEKEEEEEEEEVATALDGN